jgi:osmotically-inducible protein OsmY
VSSNPQKESTVKTDAELKRDVEAELAWDPSIRATAIGVAVKDGVVTLTGHIETYAEKHAAEKALRRVAGVKAIAVELDVRLSPQHRRSDTDIAIAAEQSLNWNTLVPDQVRVTVDHGWITLQGEVEWDFQRRSAGKAVHSLMGVVGVSNEITLKERVITKGDLQSRIADALKRQVEREVKNITIDIDGSTVTLRGRVNSWHERDAVQGVAWTAPGVRTVVNELRLG